MPPSSVHDTAIDDQTEEMESNFLQVGGFVCTEKSPMPEIEKKENVDQARQPIIWFNVIMITLFHLLAAYMLLAYIIHIQYLTILWGKFGFI